MDAQRRQRKRYAGNATSSHSAIVFRRACLQKPWSRRLPSRCLHMKTWRSNYPRHLQPLTIHQEHQRDQSWPLLVWQGGFLTQRTMKSSGIYLRLVLMSTRGYVPLPLRKIPIDCLALRYPKIGSTWILIMIQQEKSGIQVIPPLAASSTSLVFLIRDSSTCLLGKLHRRIRCIG